MPKFGAPAGRRQAERQRTMYISTFKDAITITRFLWEDPSVVWYEYPEHYDNSLKISYPCVSRMPENLGLGRCVGCTMPVADEFETDQTERQKDYGWNVRRVGLKYIVPTLNAKGYLQLRKVSGTFRDKMITCFKVGKSIVNIDYQIARSGTGFDTTFDPEPVGEAAPRKYTEELRLLYSQVAEGLSAGLGTEAYNTAWEAWARGNAALGVPNSDALDKLMEDKYAEAVEKYAIDPAELERRYQRREEANSDGASSANPAPPVAEPPAAATATVDTGTTDQIIEMGKLAAELQQWGVPYPGDTTLEQMRTLHGTFAPSHRTEQLPVDPPTQPAPAQPAAPAEPTPPAPPAAAPAAAAAAPDPGVGAPLGGDMPPFREWNTADVRDWLNENKVPWDTSMARSALLTLAEKKVTGY